MKVTSCAWVAVLCVSWSIGGRALAAEAVDSMTLADALREARKNNPSMISARKAVTAAEGARRNISFLSNPEFEGSVAIDGGGLDEVEVWQPIPFPGTRRAARKTAEHRTGARREMVRETWASVYSRVRAAFDRVMLDRRIIDLAMQKLGTMRLLKSRVELDHRAGRKLKNDLLRATISLSEAEEKVASAQRDLRIDIALLNILVGRFPTAPLQVSGELEEPQVERSLDELLAIAEKKRPDVLRAAQELAVSTAVLKSERLARWPSPAFGWRNSPGGNGRENAVLLGFEVPLWNMNAGGIERAKAEREAMIAASEGIRNLAAFEVYEAHLDYELARKRFELARDLLEQAGELIKLAGLRYREGEIGLLVFLDQADAGSGARVEHVRRLFKLNAAVTRLESVIHDSLRGEDYLP